MNEGTIGIMKMLFMKAEMFLGYINEAGGADLKDGTANTSIVNHAGKTYALMENNLPFAIKLHKEVGKFEIESKGYDDMDGTLIDAMSAHPRVDRDTNQLMQLAYGLGTEDVHLYTFDKNFKMERRVPVTLTSSRMIHDLQITKDYLIVADLPIEFDP